MLREFKSYSVINIMKFLLYTILIFIFSLGCSISNTAIQPNAAPVRAIPKAFPDGNKYYLIYSIPSYFPKDIPVYNNGNVDKIYVYDERDMDIVLHTQEQTTSIIEFYIKELPKSGWTIGKVTPVIRHKTDKINIPLKYKNKHVDSMLLNSENEVVITSYKKNITMNIKIYYSPSFPVSYVFQSIRLIK